MENRRTVKITVVITIGGALLSAFLLLAMSVFAYEQNNTHPALTDEIVDFYNLNFSDSKLTEEEKQWLVEGSIDEDFGERPLFHFYDPIYNRGIAGLSSKEWALKPRAQANYYNSQLTGFAAISDRLDSNKDFSYGRALRDYAKGDKKRALTAFGHVLHLLEDAGVPDHTRNDPHPPFFDEAFHQASPYEHEMAKWNPKNFNIARSLFLKREKPVLLENIENYFDKVAKYSNNNFFSKDTISNKNYNSPDINNTKRLLKNGEEKLFIISTDRNNKEFPIAFIDVVVIDGRKKIKDISLTKPEIGSYILDGYWERLSKEVVINGAGALKLFLEEAEKARQEYLANGPKKNKNFLAQLLGVFGVGNDSAPESPRFDLSEDPRSNLDIATGDSRSDLDIATATPATAVSTPKLTPEAIPNKNSQSSENAAGQTTPTPTSISPSPKASISAETELNRETTSGTGTPSPTTGPAVVAAYFNGGGGGGGGGGGQTATPAPTPTPTPTPSTTPIPTPTPTSTPTPTPTPEIIPTLGLVVINEIAWMGTASSSSDEWIELYNTSSKSTDISSWTLKALDGTPDIKLASKSIDPFGFYLLERTNNNTISNISAEQTYTGALGNSGEVLELRDASGQLQDLVSKSFSGWYAGNNETKSSMERIDPLKSGNDSANWGTNNGIIKNGLDSGSNPVNGTPRSKNSLFAGQKPGKITDLAISSASGNKVNFSWSAPLDKDTLPADLQYEFRYATKSFDLSTDWDLASKSLGLPPVDNLGKTATHSLAIDDFGKTYYFAIKTKDSDNNFSDISNQASYLLPSAVSGFSWPMSGFDQVHSLRTAFLGPASSSASVKWGIQLLSSPPINFGQPVIAPNGTIYYGASNGTTMAQLRATAPNGADKWQYVAPSGAAIGTPVALSDNSIAFGYLTIATDFTKLDANGSAKFTSAIGTINSVTVDNFGITYFTTSADKLFATAPNGADKWQASKEGIGGFTPIIYEDKIYITARISGTPTFYAFDAKNGDFLWSKSMVSGSPSCCGVSDVSYDADNDLLYAAADQYILEIDRDGNTLEQFFADGQVGWGYTTTMVSQDSDNLVFGLDFSIQNPASKSAVYAVNKSTKEVSWKYQVDAKVNKQITIDSDGNSYFSTQNGWVYSLNQEGNLNWKTNLSGTTSAYPVIGPGVLYVTLDGARLVKIAE